MKILITGGSGQLAFDCNEILGKKNEILLRSHSEMDITNIEQSEKIIGNFNPDIILNCAAYTKVDACETEKELASQVNAVGPKNLAEINEKQGSKLIHISTDYVFNGQKEPPDYYVESDSTDPMTYYGKTKLEGEEAIKKVTESYAIIRTAWLYGMHGGNFLKTLLKLTLKNPKNQLKVVCDQFGTITWTHRLALQIEKIIETDGKGIYHATSEGFCTWFKSGDYFLRKMEIPHNLTPCSTGEYPTPAPRPATSILDNKKLYDEGINIMCHWKDDINMFVMKFREQLIEEANKST